MSGSSSSSGIPQATKDAAQYLQEHQVYEKIHAAILSLFEQGMPEDYLQALADYFEHGQVPKIIIDGPPSSGKSTHAKLLEKERKLVLISVEDLLSQEVRSSSEMARRAKEAIDASQPVPDEVVLDLVEKRLSQTDCQKQGWILDGFPRTHTQARALKVRGFFPNSFIRLSVPDDVVIERICGRAPDSANENQFQGSRYGQQSTQGQHNSETTVKQQLAAYHRNMERISEVFSSVIHDVDASGSVDDIHKNILAELEHVGKYTHAETHETFPLGITYDS